MITNWDKAKGNYGKKIHKGVGFSIFNFQFSIFIAAASTAAIIIIVLSAPHCDVAAKSAGADLVCDWGDSIDKSNPHTLFPSATAMDVTMPLQKACAAPNAQADLKLTGQLPAASFQHNPTADSERAGQPNDLTELRVATDGRKEVNPAACRGGNARVSGRRSAGDCKLDIVDCRLKTNKTYIVTAYCPCSICCGTWSKHRTTASGHKIRRGDRFAAAARHIPFGTRIAIPGYNGGKPVAVKDRGGAIIGNRIDVFFDSHRKAKKWGVRELAL